MKEGLKNTVLPALLAGAAFVLSLLRAVSQQEFFFWLLIIPVASGSLLLHVLLEHPLLKKRVLYIVTVLLNFLGAFSILCVFQSVFPMHAEWQYRKCPYILIPYHDTYKWHNIFLMIAYIAAFIVLMDGMAERTNLSIGAGAVMGICFLVAALLGYSYESSDTSLTDILYIYLPRLLMTGAIIAVAGNPYYVRE